MFNVNVKISVLESVSVRPLPIVLHYNSLNVFHSWHHRYSRGYTSTLARILYGDNVQIDSSAWICSDLTETVGWILSLSWLLHQSQCAEFEPPARSSFQLATNNSKLKQIKMEFKSNLYLI